MKTFTKLVLAGVLLSNILLFQNCSNSLTANLSEEESSESLEDDIFTSSSNNDTNKLNVKKRPYYEGRISFDGKVITGFLCANKNTQIKVYRGGKTHTLSPALTLSGNDFKRQGKFLYDLCDRKFDRLAYFSHRLPGYFRSGSTFKVNGWTQFSPYRLNSNLKSVGIQYTTYHCPMSSSYGWDRVFNIDSIVKGTSSKGWGPVNWHHWIEKPFDGYYCLSRDTDLIQKHAVQLMNAGVDYIYIDITNDPLVYNANGSMKWDFERKIHSPLMKIIDVYKNLESKGIAVPKIALWIGATKYYKNRAVDYNQSVLKWAKTEFNNRAGPLRYKGFESKPIIFMKVANKQWFDWGYVKDHFESSKSHFKPIIKWANVEAFMEKKPYRWVASADGSRVDPKKVWRFKESCQYKSDGEPVKDCKQNAIANQISVAAAEQRPVMTDTDSLSKRRGRSFFQQFQGAFDRSKKYISISNWNNWLTNRYCHGSNRYGLGGGAPTSKPSLRDFDDFKDYGCDSGKSVDSRGLPLFVDSYTYQYSRVLEPSRSEGDCHYQLMRALVHSAKLGHSGIPYDTKKDFIDSCNFQLVR